MEAQPVFNISHFYGNSYRAFLSEIESVKHFVQLSLGLHRKSSPEEAERLILEETTLRIQFSENPSVELIHGDYSRLAVNYGFLSAITAMELFIRDSWITLEIADHFKENDGKANLNEIRKCQKSAKEKSQKLGFEKSFYKELENRNITAPHFKYYEKLKKCRNCIVHRNGIVEEKDINKGLDHLSVIWVKQILKVGGEEIVFGKKTKGGNITISFEDEEKQYRPGEVITMSNQDLMGVLWTLWRLSVETFNGINGNLQKEFNKK